MILQRYIFKELIVYFALAFMAVTSVFLVGTLFHVSRTIEGLGGAFMAKTALMATGYVAPWAMLVAACTSATTVYGRMAADNEIDATRTCGWHANRVMAPAFLFGILLVMATYGILEYVSPATHYARRVITRESVLAVFKVPPPGSQRFKVGDYVLAYTDYKDGRMERPYLVKFGPRGIEMEYHAGAGSVIIEEGRSPRVVFSRPEMTKYEEGGKVTHVTADSDFPVDLRIDEMFPQNKRPPDMNRAELLEAMSRTRDDSKLAEIATIFHVRYAQSLAPLLLILVSVPIGISVKRGSRMAGLGAALPPLLLYLILFFGFQGMGERGRVAPFVAAYAPNAVLLVVAGLFLKKVYRT